MDNEVFIVIFSFLRFITSIYVLIIGIFVFFQNLKSKLNFLFFLLCYVSFVWLFTYSINNFLFFNNIITKKQAITIFKIGEAHVGFIPLLGIHIIKEFINIKTKFLNKFLILNYIILISLLIIKIFTNLLIKNIQIKFYGIYPLANLYNLFFLLYFTFLILFIFGYSLLFLKTNFKILKKFDIIKIKYILFAFFIYSFATLNYLTTFQVNIFPIGFIFAALFITIIGYCIIKFNFFDINIINKSLTYSILISFITIIYVLLVYIIEFLFKSLVNYNNLFINVLLIFILTIIFLPFKNYLQISIDKLLFKAPPDKLAERATRYFNELKKFKRSQLAAALTTGLAHEIRNPLTVIKTFIEYLPKKQHDPNFIETFSKLTNKEIQRIEGLLDNLMHFIRPHTPTIKPIQIDTLINEIIHFLHPRFEQQHIKIHTKIENNLPEVLGDYDQLKQCILNLILNAVEVMNQGGILSVCVRSLSKGVEICLIDSGGGVDKETFKYLCEPFYTTKPSGTGLGLAICKDIIENHKGRIFFENITHPDGSRGLKCCIILPASV